MRVIDNEEFNKLPKGTVFYKNGFFGVKANKLFNQDKSEYTAICVLPEYESKIEDTAGINTTQHVSAELGNDGSAIFVYETSDIQYLLNIFSHALNINPLPQTGKLPYEMDVCQAIKNLLEEFNE